jgi:PEP-CTERM motif
MFLDANATSYSRSAIADVASIGTFFASNEIATFGPGIPEPSTWAMMAVGFAGLGFAGYRKARAGATLTA